MVDARLCPASAKPSKNSETTKGSAGRGQAPFFYAETDPLAEVSAIRADRVWRVGVVDVIKY